MILLFLSAMILTFTEFRHELERLKEEERSADDTGTNLGREVRDLNSLVIDRKVLVSQQN